MKTGGTGHARDIETRAGRVLRSCVAGKVYYCHSRMIASRMVQRVGCALLLASTSVGAQTWRSSAASLGSTARVLIIGAHPDDEDNALIAWLSLGRNVETAYLSLTRGESGPNIAGNERQSALGVVRTAELLAERARDGAHQYFTRAYDMGAVRSDSALFAAWPRDSLLVDVVSVIRAFRPSVVISLFSDSLERDPAHRAAASLARAAFMAAGDSLRFPPSATSRLPAWSASRLLTLLDSASTKRGRDVVALDVGELDRANGRSYAEIGADVRRLQRTQPPPPAPPVGHLFRFLRLDAVGEGDVGSGLFGGVDTAWTRFTSGLPLETRGALDSLVAALRDVRTLAASAPPDVLTTALARVVKHALDTRTSFNCSELSGVPTCAGTLGDLALSVTRVRERATRALMGAAGVIIDGGVSRERVAERDSVPVSVSVYNGSAVPIVVRRLAASGVSGYTVLARDSAIVLSDSVRRWASNLKVQAATLHWWQVHGLLTGTWIHDVHAPRGGALRELIAGEDRIPSTGVEATVGIAGVDVPIIERPLVFRDAATVRGDARHPLVGITPISVLLERTAEYERASLPIDRIVRVFVSSARTTPETTSVSLRLPKGLRADSASRVVIIPPLGSRNVFFRLRGRLTPGRDSISAVVYSGATPVGNGAPVEFQLSGYRYGVITRDYPHIPSQQYIRGSSLRLEVVDLRVPSRLRVAYVKGNDDVQTWLGQLQINVQALEPSLLSVVDLSVFSTVLIGADALANDALAGTIPSLRDFARRGGTIVVLPGGGEVMRSGLLPFPISFDTIVPRVIDPAARVRATEPKSSLLAWPNAITAKDFEEWSGELARNVPVSFDPRYRTVLRLDDPDSLSSAASILVGPLGAGSIIHTSLSLDRELGLVHSGAARLFVNLLSAGLRP